MLARLRPLCTRSTAATSALAHSRSNTSIRMTRSLSALTYMPKLQASIPEHLPAIQHLVNEYERMVREFQPSPKVDSNEVFANNHLRLSTIDVVGFDYDYTLCHYSEALQHLIYAMARDFLVQKLRYPESLATFQFDPSFAVRGLTIDREKGLLCKLSAHQKLSSTGVYRGRERLSRDDILQLYDGARHVSAAYRRRNMEPLNDLFSVAHACLFADVVQFLVDADIAFEPVAIVEDVHAAIAQVHVSGAMHAAVASDLERYIEPNPALLPLLERIQASGKKLFLCTNSSFQYIDAGLSFMLGTDWRRLFEVVIVSARKPDFYTRRRAFRLLEPDLKQWQAVRALRPNQVYTQGSLHDLMRLTGWGGNRVLYIGDSLFSDLVEPSRINGWRTGAIIRELEDEITVQRTPEYQCLAFQLSALEELMRAIQNELRRQAQPEACAHAFVDHLVDIHQALQDTMEHRMNAHFGSVFRADSYPSQFATFVQRYVDIYSARLENLLEYPSSHTFYPERLGLPHELRTHGTSHFK